MPSSRHYSGLPEKLRGDGGSTQEFPIPRVLLIEHRDDGIFLVRYSESGEFAGDTWHQSVNDAKAQADAEYGNSVGDWRKIPEDETDSAAFVVSQIEHE